MKAQILALFLFAVIIVAGCTGGKEAKDIVNEEVNGDISEKVTENAPAFGSFLKVPSGYAITYKLTTSYSGTSTESVMKQVVSGEKVKTEVAVEANGQEVTSTSYLLDSKFYSCSSYGSQTMCYEFPMDKAQKASAEIYSQEAQTLAPLEKNVYSGTKTLAGRTAYCYKLYEDQGTYTWCLDSQTGLMLALYTTASGATTSMEATQFSIQTPSPSEFELPAAPQQMPSYN